MKTVSIFMDVEDPINPLADDAAVELARLFSEAGVRGSFCLTGDKCRTLMARGRTDAIEAYRPHCLGLHTDTHSRHPSTMELLEKPEFKEGCEAAFEAESKGFEAFEQAFGRDPVFWGGAGNTWSVEITDALKRLGIPAYAYALSQFPNEAVHLFNGVIGMPQALSVSELDWADDERAADCSVKVLDAIQAIPQPWIGVFVGHPTKFRYTQYWDIQYNAGRTPPSPEFTEPHPVETYDRSKKNLAAFLSKAQDRFEVIGVDEALRLGWEFREPTESELEFFRVGTERNMRGAATWPIHHPTLDPTKMIEKTLALADTAKVGFVGARA
ncbi:MAG TPA: hypothetical protein VG944_17385 [Fimbriimonas sp.]|nr:hypothetical protein [Fimbriimonas sp.]